MKLDVNPNRKNYYRQLNNELDPVNSCQVTAMAQCLDIIRKQDLDPLLALNPKFKQPEDCLRDYIQTNQVVQDFYKKSHPGNHNIPAPEWADVMVFAVNYIFGYKLCYFDDMLNAIKIDSDLMIGLPLMVSMKYAKIPGHYVSIVGLDSPNLIIDDPYKNNLTGGPDGYHCIYNPDDWRAHSKGYGIRFNGGKK